ncbi:integral peroxisomal membrane peroxin [Pseudohyphozyma bogoriensis]|nr:integral peroxisomal membrane peroxin [Pseudohyphozyma bogoriensis]
MVSTSTPLAEEPTPTDLLLATPPAILKLLTLTSPVIYSLTTFVQLLTWTHPSFFASLLVLLGWWTLCLFGTYLFKYGINLLILTYILYKYLSSSSTRAGASASHRHRQRSNALTPASYQALLSSAQVLATHVHSLKATLVHPLTSQLKFISHQAGKPVPAYTTAWFAVTSYPFYLALTYFVPLRFIFLAVGSFAILWNAPFFRTLRVALRKSAAVRWVARIVIAILSGGVGLRAEIRRTRTGLGVPGLLGKKKTEELIEERPVKSDVVDGSGGEDDVQLLFTCMENQRWWVGLDWTHALLPGERASWTDPALNPSSPPASFQLPPPSITYTPSPTRDDPNSRIKRTTEWKWLDPEWKIANGRLGDAEQHVTMMVVLKILTDAAKAYIAAMTRGPSSLSSLRSGAVGEDAELHR